MTHRQPVLLVEDDHVDILMVRRAFLKNGIKNPLDVVTDGEEALNYLKKLSGKHPRYILLDLNLPKLNGKDVLKEIKGNNNLKSIPVIILSTSSYISDIKHCFELSAAGYIVKPNEVNKLNNIINTIHQYWTYYCKMPEDIY